jgi:bifunctional pyridoxal-dependent enzyme with beta-cystathionase and maltose regulon repressor activities
MRLSFACSMETLEQALRRIEGALSAAIAKRA